MQNPSLEVQVLPDPACGEAAPVRNQDCAGKMDAHWRAANYLSVGQIYPGRRSAKKSATPNQSRSFNTVMSNGVVVVPDQESDVATFSSWRRMAIRFCSVRRLIPSISAARLRFPPT